MPEEFEAGVKFVASDEGVSSTLDEMGTHFQRTTTRMREFIGQTGYVKLALTRIATYTAIFTFFGTLAKLIGEAITLQRAFAEVSTLVDMRNKSAAASFDFVTASILKLSPYLGTATELTHGMYEIMSAGVNKPVEAFKLMIVSAKYAKAGLTDLATAASTLTAVMKAYGYTADEMRAKSDQLFASVMEGKYHAVELNQAIGKVLPTAAAMGVHVDEVSAALAVLTQRGLDVNEAATALNRILLGILRPIDKAKKEFVKLGFAWGRDALVGQGLLGFLRRLMEAQTRYGDLLPKIFRRQRALRGAFVLAGEGFKDYIRLLDKIRRSSEEGGEVQRAYGKMIGTVGEEWKAAMAKMQRAMFEVFSGRGFKVMAGFIRMLGNLMRTIVKSGEVIFPTLALYLTFGKALKFMSAMGLKAAFGVEKAAKAMKAGTTILNTNTAALNANAMSWRVAAQRIALVNSALIAALVVYLLAKTYIDGVNAKLDEQIDLIHKETKRIKTLRTELNLWAAASRSVGESTKGLTKELRRAAAIDLEKNLQAFGKYNEVIKALILRLPKGTELTSDLYEAMSIVATVHSKGTEKTDEYWHSLEYLADAYGLVDKKMLEYIETSSHNIEKAEQVAKAMVMLTRVQRDWSSIVEASSSHYENLAKTWDKEKLQSVHATLSRILKLTPDDPAFKKIQDYFKEIGLSSEEALKIIKDAMDNIGDAMEALPRILRQLKIDEVGREMEVAFRKVHPEMDTLIAYLINLRKYQEKYTGAFGDSEATMRLFVSTHKEQIQHLINNIERLEDAQDKAFVRDLEKYLTKGTSAQVKWAKKALSLREGLVADFIRIESKMNEFRNELRQEEYNNVVEQTQKLVTLENRKIKKWVQAEIQGGKTIYEIWAELVRRKIALNELLEMANAVARQRQLGMMMEENKRILDLDYEFTWQRVARAREMYGEMEQFVLNLKNVTKTEMRGLMTLLLEFWKYVKKLEKGDKPIKKWTDALRFAGRELTALVANLKDFADVMGISGGVIMRIIGALDALAKGCRTVRAGLDMVAYAATDAVKGVAATVMKIGGWIGVAVGAVTALVSVFGALFGKKKKTEAEIMAEKIQKVQRELRNFGRVSEGVARQFLELRSKIGTSAATLELLVDIMNDAGVSTDNFTEYLDVLLGTLDDIERSMNRTTNAVQRDWERQRQGIERGRRGLRGYRDEWRGTYHDFNTYSPADIEKAILDMGVAFAALVEHAKRLGLEGSPKMIEFIQNVRELGLSIKEVDDYVIGWLERASTGLTAMIEASSGTREELANLGELTLATFNSLIAQGMSYIEALELMAEPLHELRRRYRDLGDESNAAVEQLMHITSVAEKYQDLFAAIAGTDEVLQALGNTGFLTQESLTAVADQAQTYYERLTAAGLTSQEALAVMAPILENLQYYADNYGLSIDANTQSLIDQATEMGILQGEAASVTDVLQAGFDDVVTAINNFTDSLALIIDQFVDIADTGSGSFDQITAAIDDTADAFDSLKDGLYWDDVDKINLTTRDYQHGAKNIGYTQLAQLHRGESVLPEGLADALRQFYGGVSGAGISGGEGGLIHNVINIDGREVYRALVPYIREGGEVGDFEVAGEAVQ
jgi:TP901 family phage tail tape measure protein